MADQHNANIPAMGNTIASDIPDIKENLEFHKDAFQAFVNSWSDTVATNIKPKVIGDANNDTLIQCEESSDENIIRFDIAGTEQVVIKDGVIEPTTDSDIALGSGSKKFSALYVDAISSGGITQGTDVTAPLRRKIVEIGDWDMNSLEQVQIAHGLTLSKIRNVSGLIRDDADANLYVFLGYDTTAPVYILNIEATYVYLKRAIGGAFDSTSFDATDFNRGWLTILYVD